MSRLDQHSAFGFLLYYLIYIIWTGSLVMDNYAVFLIVFFSMFPDLDIFYGGAKSGGIEKLDDTFQHHYFSWAHYPITYTPSIVIFIISLIFNFYPLYFLTPVVGIYFGHFLFDTIACGDGIMWGKNPFKRNSYARFINIWYSKTDGYHGRYWEARYRETIICKIGNVAVLVSAVIIQILHIIKTFVMFPDGVYDAFYLVPLLYFLGLLYFGLHLKDEEFIKEPSNGRYSDFRIDPKYINGLSEKNKKRHLEKYAKFLNRSI